MSTPVELSGSATLRDQLRAGRVVWALLIPAASLALSLATYAIASRLLTQVEFASFAVGIALLATLVPFVSLGTPTILVRRMAGDADPDGTGALQGAAYLLVMVAGAAVLGLALVLVLLSGQSSTEWLTPGLWPIVVMGAAGVALTDLRMAVYQARFQFRQQFLGLAAAALSRVAGVYFAIRMAPEASHRAALAGYVAASVLSALFILRFELAGAFRRARETFALMKHDVLRLGLPLTMSSVLAVLTTQIDTLVATAFLEPADVAQYAVAGRLSMVHSTAIGGLTAVALPVAAALARRGSLQKYARMSVVIGLSVGTLALILSFLVGQLAVVSLFGVAYAPSVPLFFVLSAGFVLNYAGNPVSQVLYMTGRAQVMVYVQAAQIVAFIGAASILAPRWDSAGLAVARSATNLLAVAVIGGLSLAGAGRTTDAGRPSAAK